MATAIYKYLQKLSQSMGDLSMNSMQSSQSEQIGIEEARAIIKKTWRNLMSDKENVGARIYEYILTKEITMSQLFMKTNINQQSAIFMVMMGKVIGFLDDPSSMDSKLIEMGELHVKKYGVKTRNFKHFRAGFMKAIKKYLPWTDKREAAWLWFWGRIIRQMTLATQANHYPLISRFNGKELEREEMIAFAHNVHVTFDTALTTDPHLFAKEFYKNLLTEQPKIGKLFSDAQSNFEVQSTRFIAMLNHAIKLLDDTNTFTIKLEALATKHVEYGVKIPMLQSFGDVLMKQVKTLNIEYYNKQQQQKFDGDDKKENDGMSQEVNILKVRLWTKDMDNSWNWFWSVVVGVFSQGMTKEIMKQKAAKNNVNKDDILNEDFSAL